MPQVPDRDKVRVLVRFRGSGNNPGVGYTPWVVPRFMLRTGSQKTNLQGNQGSRTKRARSTSNRWQGGGQRDNKSARLGSGNPGFQYTLWVAPRFRKRGFQEDKVPGTQGIPEIPQPILGALWRVPHMPIHVRLLSGRTASVDWPVLMLL